MSGVLLVTRFGRRGFASCWVVTLVWKLSIHAAVVAGAVTILVQVFGLPLLVLAPLVALVCWSRVALRDHTPAQTVAGAALGASDSIGTTPAS